MDDNHNSNTIGNESLIPFGVNFEVPCFERDNHVETTTTTSMADDDTGTYRKETDDHDT